MTRIAFFILLAAAMALSGCLSASVREETDPYRDEPEYSREVSFSSTDRFEDAQRLVQERDFEAAIAIYRNVYQTSPVDEDKARALLEWAMPSAARSIPPGTRTRPGRDSNSWWRPTRTANPRSRQLRNSRAWAADPRERAPIPAVPACAGVPSDNHRVHRADAEPGGTG